VRGFYKVTFKSNALRLRYSIYWAKILSEMGNIFNMELALDPLFLYWVCLIKL